ncbi:MAG: hypothetical protein ACO4AI_07910, partial [Prochlorothrix sp.]
LEKTVLQKANGVITTVGGVLHEQLKRLAPQQTFVVLANGYDAELITSVKATPPEGVFHVVYTGLLTENQEYKPVLEVLSKLQKGKKPQPVAETLENMQLTYRLRHG